jgi:hypothetical protein
MPAPGSIAQPVAPFPPGTPPVILLGKSAQRPDWLLAQLRRLHVAVQESNTLTAPCECSAIILTDPARAAAQLAQIRGAGLVIPVGVLVRNFGQAGPDGMPAIAQNVALSALRAFLMPHHSGPAIVPATDHAADTALRRLRLLAAEDNKTNQLVFRKMLKTADLDLTMVADGQELLEAYLADRPDIIFTDISMPRMDGLEASRLIRHHAAEQGLSRVPIIAMTAHAMDGDRERILAAGIDEYLTKPLNKTGLLAMIDRFAPGHSRQDDRLSATR